MNQKGNSNADPEKLVSLLVKLIIGNSKNFQLAKTQEEDLVKIEIKLPKEEMGKIVGRGGTTIWAIRRLAGVAGANLGKKVLVSLTEEF